MKQEKLKYTRQMLGAALGAVTRWRHGPRAAASPPVHAADVRSGTAVITGASSGIGEAFARETAARGYDLVLVARREDRLAALAAELAQRHQICAEYMVADLSRPDAIERIAQRVGALDHLAMLVNNAGFDTLDTFAESDLAEQLDMIQVHVIASVWLTRAALPCMIARGRGAIVNVASIGAFMYGPRNVTYAATKAYLVSFSRSLALELVGTGVRVQALCPGFTYTGFHDRFPKFDRSRLPGWLWMPAEAVVTESFGVLDTGRVVCIPGPKNRLIVALARTGLISVLVRLLAQRAARRRDVIHNVSTAPRLPTMAPAGRGHG